MVEFRYADGFRPGDKVTIRDGTFLGMAGTVVSAAEVAAMREQAGHAPPAALTWPGRVWVMIEIFGRPVAVDLEAFQVRLSV